MATVETLMDEVEKKMMSALDALERDFGAYRTGMASPSLVEGLMVDYYGTQTRMKEIAGITTPEPRLLVIQPWDPSSVATIEKAVIASNLGISPVSDGRLLRLPIPELSEERRATLAKQVKSRAEDARIAVRNIRRDANDTAKKSQKASDITEDDLKDMLEQIQKLTDDYIKEVDLILSKKEDELMNI